MAGLMRARKTPQTRTLTGLAAVLLATVPTIACDETTVVRAPPPGSRVDSFQQASVSKIDVLWVVDNSSSMTEEQENLGRNFDRFLGFLTGAKVDYRIAVTSTDAVNDAGKLLAAEGKPAIITNETPNPVAAFSANVKVKGTGGNAREQGLDAARRALELNAGSFLRADAFLFIIFVSDEDDYSAPGTPRFFYRYFEGLKGKGNEGMITAGAIVGDVPAGCVSGSATAEAGARYKEVVEQVGGRIGSICSAEFDGILRDMGLDAVGLKRKFALSQVPNFDKDFEVTTVLPCDTAQATRDLVCTKTEGACTTPANTFRCTVRKQEEGAPDGWSYEIATNTLLFHGAAVPPKGATIEAYYFVADEKTDP